ncbi:hypothetical protein [Allosphingosinicella deserti]|uniref:Uncharacterized protein n=1 Tax=Allosphingosinicella deserti TaxID=2116704 RepID=A0A2P7QVH1_9SPHN|nr:hypothetical protein [Sphingomonas deserti]PSJ41962.1 hypothetical protein C7I55_06800 [Sphingomonas deserti]
MPSRIRELTDPFGLRLRISVEPHPKGAMIVLERYDAAGRPRIHLDSYGGELLSGFIMAARLALPHPLPNERCDGAFPSELSLTHEPKVSIRVRQDDTGVSLEIPAPFWDKLYAELCLVIPHAREFTRNTFAKALVH